MKIYLCNCHLHDSNFNPIKIGEFDNYFRTYTYCIKEYTLTNVKAQILKRANIELKY